MRGCRQCREQSHFFEFEVPQGPAEIVPGSSFKPVSPVAQKYLVAIKGHDLGLGVMSLYLNSKEKLLKLSLETLLRGQEAQAAKLLCNCAGPLLFFPRQDVFDCSPH